MTNRTTHPWPCIMVLIAMIAATFTGHVWAQDRIVLFATEEAGESKAIPNWGLDTAWYSEENVRRGAIFMGADRVDVVRISFTPTAALVNGDLQSDEIAILNNRLAWVDRWANASTTVCINEDSPTVDSWFKYSNGTINPTRWGELISVTASRAQVSGRTVVAVAPFNEPDYYRSERLADMQTFYDTAEYLLDKRHFKSIRISGGNTLNTDQANPWYNFLVSQLDEGNTHQLAGSFDNYASFFENVVAQGDHATNDELHNVMEAMVGAEYGMETGIWWGTAERARGEFVYASDGDRLGYAEHRPHWTAASVYRAPNGDVKAFVGESERQALPTTYRFFSKDRPVFYDGHGPQRAYTVTTTGGDGYQTSDHCNAERVVNVTWGEDVQPAIDGRYVIVNRKSHKVLGVANASHNDGALIKQYTYTGALNQQWDINPLPHRFGGDYSYMTIVAAHSGVTADVQGWSYDNGAVIQQWDGDTNVFEQFYLEYVEDGWFKIHTRWCDKVWRVSDGSMSSGAQIVQWEDTGSSDQQWRLVPVPEDANESVNPIDFSAPSAPTGLLATANAVSVQLNWDANGERDLAGYTVLRSTSPEGSNEIIARDITTPYFTDSSATQPIPYRYVVRAVDKSLNHSDHSDEAWATPTGAEALAAYYDFEGDCNDASINAQDAELQGTPIYVSGGLGATCLRLDGAGSHVDLPADVASHDQMTVATWVYWMGGATWQRIFDFGNETSSYLFLTPDSGSGMRFSIKNQDEEEQLNTSFLATGQWTHVAVTLGDQTATLYVNGINVAHSSSFTMTPSDFKPVLNYIGKSQFAADPLFNGMVDDFRIYNYAMTATEVAGLTDVVPTPPAQSTITLVNPGFEEGPAIYTGFDVPGYDVPGWSDAGISTDSGVDGPGPWFGARDNYAAFLKGGDGGALQLTGYTIQEGDEFSIDLWAASWNWSGSLGRVKATLFYDNGGTRVEIGSYTTPTLTAYTSGYTQYSNTAKIEATPESVGKILGIWLRNTGVSSSYATLDDISLTVSTALD